MRPKPVKPKKGQESVWDYPRPPRLEPSERHVVVTFAGTDIADTRRAFRVLETSHPPVFYIPREDIRADCLVEATRGSFCEFKGRARYVDVQVGDRVAHDAGWFYADPTEAFLPIRDYIAFYPAAMDRCTVDGETVKPQPGEFYGGWVTPDVVGPFKGAPGSEFW